MHAETYPSLPNYVAMTSGAVPAPVVGRDCQPTGGCVATSDVDLRSDRRAPGASTPSRCPRTAAARTPATASTCPGTPPPRTSPTSHAACLKRQLPLGTTTTGALASDLRAGTLAAFSLVAPNTTNDAHGGCISCADAWLARWIPRIVASPAYQDGSTAVFVTYDSDDKSSKNHIATMVIAPSVKPGTVAVGGVQPLLDAAHDRGHPGALGTPRRRGDRAEHAGRVQPLEERRVTPPGSGGAAPGRPEPPDRPVRRACVERDPGAGQPAGAGRVDVDHAGQPRVERRRCGGVLVARTGVHVLGDLARVGRVAAAAGAVLAPDCPGGVERPDEEGARLACPAPPGSLGAGWRRCGDPPPHAASAGHTTAPASPRRHIVVSLSTRTGEARGRRRVSITGIPGWGSSRASATPVSHRDIPTLFRLVIWLSRKITIGAQGSRAQGSAGAGRGGGGAVPGGRRERARRAAQARPAHPPGRERGDAHDARALVAGARRARGGSSATASTGTAARSAARRRRGFAVSGLRCGTNYAVLGPRGRRAGRLSRRAVRRVRTAACPPPDTEAPPARRPGPVGAVGGPPRPHVAAGDRQRAGLRLPRLAATASRSPAPPRRASRSAGSRAAGPPPSPSLPTTPPGTSRSRRRSPRAPRRAPLRRPARGVAVAARRRPRDARRDEARRHGVLHRAGDIPRAQRDPGPRRPAVHRHRPRRRHHRRRPADELRPFGRPLDRVGDDDGACVCRGRRIPRLPAPAGAVRQRRDRRRRAAREDRRTLRRQGVRRRRIGGRPGHVLRRLRRRHRLARDPIPPATTSRWASPATDSAPRPPAS